MNRRDFMCGVAAGFSATRISGLVAAEQNLSGSPRAWLKDTPFVAVGSWDDMPIFFRRVGGQGTWEEADYRNEHTEETVRKLKDLGVTIAIIDFFKGFGLEAEAEHITLARKMAGMLHENGIRVGLYVGSTIAYETFLLEEPSAQEWFVPDYLGRPVIYGDQTFRKRVYFMHPGYVNYIKRVVRMGVEDLKADLIHFDNTSLQGRPEIFQHPLAIKEFREYLQSACSALELKERLGFSNMKYVLPPVIETSLAVIDDPLFQLWTDFRCSRLNQYYADMQTYVHQLNPAVVIDSNPSSGMAGTNTIWEQGISYPGLFPHMEISWTEEGNYAEVRQDGTLVSKIRTYKTGSILGTQIVTYTAGGGYYGEEGGNRASMAESMVFNRQSLGMVGGVLKAPELPEDQKQYIRFFHQNFQYYKGVQNVPDAAVLYSYASMGFNNDRPASSFMLFTQALIQAMVPFDIIFDEHLEDLSKYRTLILADQECLSDEQMDLIRKYVIKGGGLVATEQSSLYTARRLRRADFGLKDLLKVSALPWQGPRMPEKNLPIAAVQHRIGRGRVTYIPSVRPAIEKPRTGNMSSKYWKLPLNWKELIDAVKWAADGRLSLEVNAPGTLAVVAELMEQPVEGRRLVHLVNFAGPQRKAVSNVAVSVELPEGKRVHVVTLLSPDTGENRTVAGRLEQGRVHFTVPGLNTYTLAVLELE
ncbi:MAG: hypothetical protein EPN47_08885 [Acidobacteria bacterium]|nr:MAG: hypothetical protein EPN47_08885 [Acidobacteriota bacterium]